MIFHFEVILAKCSIVFFLTKHKKIPQKINFLSLFNQPSLLLLLDIIENNCKGDWDCLDDSRHDGVWEAAKIDIGWTQCFEKWAATPAWRREWATHYNSLVRLLIKIYFGNSAILCQQLWGYVTTNTHCRPHVWQTTGASPWITATQNVYMTCNPVWCGEKFSALLNFNTDDFF